MALTLYLHPLSSFCHKVLIALYENGTPFTPQMIDLSDADNAAAFKKIWPVGKFPVLRDAGRVIPESTSIIEYLAIHYPGATALVPKDAEAAFEARAQDRFYDLHVHTPMQQIVGHRLRPADKKDAYGEERARAALGTGLAVAEQAMTGRAWAAGDAFSMADCAAAPPLFYCNMVVEPLAGRYPNLAAYLERMQQRSSYARALKEAEPFLHMVPR